jgi:hypothetical protein
VDKVEWTLILMPLPRLQVVGGETERLLYQVGWGLEIERSRAVVAAYQRTGTGFDNRILLYPGVGDHLVMLNGLLRPLVHRAWSAMVAQLNGLDESRLESFLFGTDRIALGAVRPGSSRPEGRNLRVSPRRAAGASGTWRESLALAGLAGAARWETHPQTSSRAGAVHVEAGFTDRPGICRRAGRGLPLDRRWPWKMSSPRASRGQPTRRPAERREPPSCSAV